MLRFPKWLLITIALVIFGGALSAVPNLLTREQAESLPSWLPSDQINLGLDLQGGAHLLLEVDVASVMEDQLKDLRSGIARTLRDEGVRRFSRPRIVDGGIVVRITNPEDVDTARKALRGMASNVSTGVGLQPDLVVSQLAGNALEIRYSEAAVNDRRSQVVRQSLEIVRRRIDEIGTREPTIQRQGDDRILVQVPGEDDPEALIATLQTTAKMTFHLVDVTVSDRDLARGKVPAGTEILYEDSDIEGGPPRPWAVKSKVAVDGADLTDARPGFGQYSEPSVDFTFNNRGAKLFADITKANVNKPFAIVLDDKVLSAPVIRSPIVGGSGQITGSFTVSTANQLAVMLRAGALPAPIKVLEERTVGPDLGADSVEAGKIAAVIGLVAVMIFMVISYGGFGLAANVALAINLVLIAGALSTLQATLTLPGIAGIVLTIGMAVDANVLVFERIREEVRAGKAPIGAVDTGYARALSTILDANVTTLIAAIIMFWLGSGPIKGFAVTLAVGIFASVFTAVLVTRLMIVTWLRRARPTELAI